SLAAALLVGGATTMMITRQTMEIFTVLAATNFDLRPEGPAVMTLAGALAALAVAVGVVVLGRRMDDAMARAAVRTFAFCFVLQVGLYAFHESAEARLLPASDVLHAATEPYGPDSEFGQWMNYTLLLLASSAAALVWLRRRFSRLVVTTLALAPTAVAAAAI